MDKQNQYYLSGDSASLGVINTAVTRGRKEVHSRGGVGTGPQFHSTYWAFVTKTVSTDIKFAKLLAFNQ